MHGAELPGPDLEPDSDDFRATLERNPLARWWRHRAGTTGETGARLIARELPPTPRDQEPASGTTD